MRLFKMKSCAGLTAVLVAACAPSSSPPPEWTEVVKTEGQEHPVPRAWLQDDEARIAHSLRLPNAAPRSVPFDFDKARWSAWLPNAPSVSLQYFDHLCRTEAGEWIVKKVENVEGLYFARPQGPPRDEVLQDRYAPEMPWLQRVFVLQGDSKPLDQAGWLIQPPLYNYRFVEQPRRAVDWQARIEEPFVRLSGYTTRPTLDQYGNPTIYFSMATPMEVVGIARPSAKHAYTWRGIVRSRDRELGIAGGEVLIYDSQTREVLAVRRQFLITRRNPRGPGDAAWEVSARCRQLPAYHDSQEFSQFAFDVLQPVEPSTTGRK